MKINSELAVDLHVKSKIRTLQELNRVENCYFLGLNKDVLGMTEKA